MSRHARRAVRRSALSGRMAAGVRKAPRPPRTKAPGPGPGTAGIPHAAREAGPGSGGGRGPRTKRPWRGARNRICAAAARADESDARFARAHRRDEEADGVLERRGRVNLPDPLLRRAFHQKKDMEIEKMNQYLFNRTLYRQKLTRVSHSRLHHAEDTTC